MPTVKKENPETEQAKNDQKYKDDPYYMGSGAARNKGWTHGQANSSNDQAASANTQRRASSEETDSYQTAADDVGNPDVNQSPRQKK